MCMKNTPEYFHPIHPKWGRPHTQKYYYSNEMYNVFRLIDNNWAGWGGVKGLLLGDMPFTEGFSTQYGTV